MMRIAFSNGAVSSRDPAALSDGEMQRATGGWYPPGDSDRIWTIGGRMLFASTGAGTAIKGIALCIFDDGTASRLIAYAGTTLYSSAPGTTGSFSSLVTGLSSSATSITNVHYNDKWYIGNGYDRNRVVESSGTVRYMGMEAPQEALIATLSSVGAVASLPSAVVGGTGSGWVNTGNFYDVETAATGVTFAGSTLSAPGSTTITYTGFTAGTSANRFLKVNWQLAGSQTPNITAVDVVGNAGGTSTSGFDVTVLLEYSVNLGNTWTTITNRTHMRNSMHGPVTESVAISANSNLVQVKATFTNNSGTSPGTLRLNRGYIVSGSPVTNFTTSTLGMYLSYTEYDSVRGLESPSGPVTGPVTMTAQNVLTLTGFPAAKRNANADQYRIYRTPDQGTAPETLGLIGTMPVTETTFVENFETFAYNVGPTPLYRLLSITIGQGTLRFPFDTPPPSLVHMNAYKGALVGIRKDNRRSLPYSMAGFPESWPEINVIEDFPMPENDELLSTAVIGEKLLIGARGLMFTTTDLPKVLLGTFNTTKVEPLRGQPGLVSERALTSFAVDGETRAAWVSRFSVHETNGLEAKDIGSDLDWDNITSTSDLSSAVLFWDKRRQTLVLSFDTDGDTANDSYYLFHMSAEHSKENGNPKLTGPHYGRISCLAAGEIGGVYTVYSGHVSNGSVYVENSGTSDASSSYSGAVRPLIMTSGKIYGPWEQVGFYRGNVRHTDFGSGETASLAVTIGRDESGHTSTRTSSISLSGHKGNEFLIARSGDWIEVTLTYLGSANGGFLDLRVDAQPMGKAGRSAVA